ncbi:MAG: hypothetical protein KDC10_13770 [Calditrichaeota bacterium]|nr:hypothetical protein [Calditrichota bacterium]
MMSRGLASGLCGLLMVAVGSSVLAVPQAGLVAWYPGEGTLEDASGNGHDGIPHNIGYQAGHQGQAIRFNGDNSWVGLELPLAGGDWTICGWAWVDTVNTMTTDWQNFVSSWDDGFAVGFNNGGGGHLSLWIMGTTAIDPAPVPQRIPFFFLFERDGSQYNIWLNDQVVASESGGYTPTMLQTIGQWVPDAVSIWDREPFDGWLDDLCVYDRVLTPEERAEFLGVPSGGEGPQLAIQRNPDATLTLSWSAIEGATDYTVYVSGTPAGPWLPLLSTAQTLCVLMPPETGQRLFRVTASQ